MRVRHSIDCIPRSGRGATFRATKKAASTSQWLGRSCHTVARPGHCVLGINVAWSSSTMTVSGASKDAVVKTVSCASRFIIDSTFELSLRCYFSVDFVGSGMLRDVLPAKSSARSSTPNPHSAVSVRVQSLALSCFRSSSTICLTSCWVLLDCMPTMSSGYQLAPVWRIASESGSCIPKIGRL